MNLKQEHAFHAKNAIIEIVIRDEKPSALERSAILFTKASLGFVLASVGILAGIGLVIIVKAFL